MEYPAPISVFRYPKVLLGLVMKFQGESGGADVRERGSGGAMTRMRDTHALMHPNARDGPLSASRVHRRIVCAILSDSFAILPKISTHHPSASGVVSCLSWTLEYGIISNFICFAYLFKPKSKQINCTASYKSLEAHQGPSRASSGLLYMPRTYMLGSP